MSANGTVSGSDSRIVIGCSHDSNCAARIRYMKMNDSANATRKACAGAPDLLGLARRARAVARRQVHRPRPPSPAPSPTSPAPTPGATLARNVHLPLARVSG